MSGNGHLHIDSNERFERRSRMTARRVTGRGAVPRKVSKWIWAIGAVTVVASVTALLLGQEPSAYGYLATFTLLGSMGLLAFVSASRALNASARYEETVFQVEAVELSYHSLRQVFTTAMDLRDQVTGGHSDRVVHLSLELGRGLGLSEERIHHLEWAAFLHDIGKVRVSEEILTKPGPLDADEWGEMQQHPYFSYSILSRVDHLQDAAEIVYCHHERYDGMGYPRRLQGGGIPLEARIFSVVDAYDAMVTERPYRQPLSHDDAVREIIGHAGTQFDPQVVALFGRWAVSVGDEGTRKMVAEELERLGPGLLQMERARWA